jgi:hypothetical protein
MCGHTFSSALLAMTLGRRGPVPAYIAPSLEIHGG